MAVSEESRHRMYQRLEDVMGHDDATTLIEHLPPVGWSGVATRLDVDAGFAAAKNDVDAGFAAAKKDVDARFAVVEHQFREVRSDMRAMEERITLRVEATLHQEISSLKSTFLMSLIAANATFVALVLAVTKLG